MTSGALDGIRVVEFATMVSGPYCGKLLADLGADVIKVEPPGGDPSRQAGPFPKTGEHREHSALYLYNNTSKRGLTLDVERREGLGVFERLIGWADALVDNHPPQRLADLGLAWDRLRELNPRLIYTSITPYGRTGPRAGVAGDELTLIHAGGLGNLLPTRVADVDRAPVKMGGYPVGYHAGVTAAFATLGAVLGQRRTGRGQLIDISLQEVVLALVRPNVAGTRYHNATWSRVPDRPPAMGRLRTSDGYIVIGAIEDHHFRSFSELMGDPPWSAGPEWLSMAYRMHHSMDIAPLIDEWAATQEKHDVHHRGARKGIPMGPVNSAEDLDRDEQYGSRDYFVAVEQGATGRRRYAGWPYHMTGTPPRVSRPAPRLGEHSREILCEVLGYAAAEFENLAETRVVSRGG